MGIDQTLKWNRHRIFDCGTVHALHALCMQARFARVTEYSQQPKSKWRPLPLNTLEMTKIASSKLGIPSHQAMTIAEALYSKGYISYPRTETDSFNPTMNLRDLVAIQIINSQWGSFASRLVNGGQFVVPRKGKKDDQAHPPIHSLKSAERSDFQSDQEFKVYELVTRHFLACCAPDAQGATTHLEVQIETERFFIDGLTVIQKNFLDVYPFVTWTGGSCEIPRVEVGQLLGITALLVKEGRTEPPEPLSESELLTLMDAEGIGTDATMHEHIKTIQERGYCGVNHVGKFFPHPLGIALIVGLSGYESLGFHLGKPELRASMEADLARICAGDLTRQSFIDTYVGKMRSIFLAIADNPSILDLHIGAAVGPHPDTLRSVQTRAESRSNARRTRPQARPNGRRRGSRNTRSDGMEGWIFIGN